MHRAVLNDLRYMTQCGKLIIFLLKRFYVKSILVNLKCQKLPLLELVNFYQQFISLKILAVEKFSNFHTVRLQPTYLAPNLSIDMSDLV